MAGGEMAGGPVSDITKISLKTGKTITSFLIPWI